MSEPAIQSRKQVRFGLFELDLYTRELRKSGLKIRLQEQPFQLLAMLLERPGEIVTREELRKRLWPSDTFVAFDLSLNIGQETQEVTLRRFGKSAIHRDSLSPWIPIHWHGERIYEVRLRQ